jgi:hypothetical protein
MKLCALPRATPNRAGLPSGAFPYAFAAAAKIAGAPAWRDRRHESLWHPSMCSDAMFARPGLHYMPSLEELA